MTGEGAGRTEGRRKDIKTTFVMPDPDPASRRRKEKAKTLDPRLKMSGMTEGGRAGMTGGGEDDGKEIKDNGREIEDDGKGRERTALNAYKSGGAG